jgi:HK97 family phage major capsid protein
MNYQRGAIAGAFLRAHGIAVGDPGGARAWLSAQRGFVNQQAADSMRIVEKAAIGAIDSSDITPTPASSDFIESMGALSAVLQLNLRKVQFATRLYDSQGMTVAAEVDEGQAIPLVFSAFGQHALNSMKVHGAIIVVTKESLNGMSEEAAGDLANELAAAVARAEDYTFLRDISTGQPTIASTGTSITNLDSDLRTAMALFEGDLRRAKWVLSPRTAAAVSLMRGTAGPAYPGMGAIGGTLVGLPAIVSEGAVDAEASPADARIFLIDPKRVAYVDGGAELGRTEQAAIQMADDADGSSVAPVTAATVVSMFQTNSVGLRALRWGAWHAALNSVVTIEGVDL